MVILCKYYAGIVTAATKPLIKAIKDVKLTD
jgi:hypothetical protein